VTFPLLADAAAAPAFQLFREPLPVWDYWYLLLIPLCVGISIVYKAIKCRDVRQVPREATVICTVILAGMVLAATALYALMRALEQR
jgi:hypothetical protein